MCVSRKRVQALRAMLTRARASLRDIYITFAYAWRLVRYGTRSGNVWEGDEDPTEMLGDHDCRVFTDDEDFEDSEEEHEELVRHMAKFGADCCRLDLISRDDTDSHGLSLPVDESPLVEARFQLWYRFFWELNDDCARRARDDTPVVHVQPCNSVCSVALMAKFRHHLEGKKSGYQALERTGSRAWYNEFSRTKVHPWYLAGLLNTIS